MTKGLGALGPVVGPTPGRADTRPADVPDGSYVVPADVVSAIGEGNTQAGHEILKRSFKPKGLRQYTSIPARARRADGGLVPIQVSDGEHLLSPEEVQVAGGPEVLDALVERIRAQYIDKLSRLPGPRK